MNVIGIVCEYNPFHNGHLYHLQKAKEIAGDGIVVAILSGYFSMRGDISVINKYDKVKTAIDNGVDITLELPYLLATQNADIFAYNSIKLLNQMGVNEIVAGSEICDIELIKKIAHLEENNDFQNLIKSLIDKGNSYRKSYSLALAKFDINISSNDMLNIKYFQSIQKINPSIKLTLIRRINNNYLDTQINDSNIQSATTIRLLDNIQNYVPNEVNEIFNSKGFYNINDFTQILKHLITTQNLNNIFQATEGIENSLIFNFNNIDELVDKLTSKRYTKSRIKRFLSYILTQTTKEEINALNIPMVRVTGFNSYGRKYLNQNKKDFNYFTRLVNGVDNIYDKEILIAKIFTNVYDEDFIKMEQSFPYIKNDPKQ